MKDIKTHQCEFGLHLEPDSNRISRMHGIRSPEGTKQVITQNVFMLSAMLGLVLTLTLELTLGLVLTLTLTHPTRILTGDKFSW